MAAYDLLASSYDRLQQSFDVSAWAAYLQWLYGEHGVNDAGDGDEGRALLLDLGCGTGRLTLEMERIGFDVIGIDSSSAMLQIGKEEANLRSSKALFLQQDISRFELYGTVDYAICTLDTVNHLIRRDQVKRFFRHCANYLNQYALLVMDLGTRHHFSETLGNQVFYQDLPADSKQPALTLLWQNRWQPGNNLSSSELTLFVQSQRNCYDRQDVSILERWYDWREIRQWAVMAGFKFVARYGDRTKKSPRPKEERMFLVFRQPNPKL